MNPNDPAFPKVCSDNGEYIDGAVQRVWSEGGMKNRDLIATMCLQGMLANSNVKKELIESATAMTTTAVTYADALIKELSK